MKLRLTNNTARTPEPEHGDWRLKLDHPEDAEHMPSLPLSVWRRVKLRVEYWQELESEPGIIPIKGWPRVLRLGLALFLLLPLSIVMVFALLMALYHAAPVVGQSRFWLSEPVWFTGVGVAGFISLMIAKLAEPLLIYLYVLGHESTHALAALLSFGKINAFRFDMDGGYVETDADNLFVALSPYFVPFWMLIWLLLLWLANLCFPFGAYEPWFYGGFGFWWAFHIYWTFWVIPREQPDMLENGLLFSMLVIMVMNIGLLLGILWGSGVITPEGYWQGFVQSALRIADALGAFFSWVMSLRA